MDRARHLVETMILTARLLQKGTSYSKEKLFYCYKELRFKTSRKERSNRRLSLRGSIGRIPELFDKKFEQRTVELSFFYDAGSNRILGNDKGVGVPVFTNCKLKTTEKRNTPE